DEIFAQRTFEEWTTVLRGITGVWAPIASARETHDDVQVVANGYLQDAEMIDGSTMTFMTSPAQFNEETVQTRPAPESGEHTEEVLLEAGYSWEQISELKQKGAIL